MKSFFAFTLAFVAPAVFFYYLSSRLETEGSSNLSSIDNGAYTETYETAETCAPERTYNLKSISTFKNTLASIKINKSDLINPPEKQCFSYIMESMGGILTNKSFAQCSSDSSELIRGDADKPTITPCRTEEYVNTVYNSLVDVMDCMNIPVRELLPKLYNESGLHVNTLGPDADAGVGQLTKQALMEVYMDYDGVPENPMALEYYLNEVKNSTKPSCQRLMQFEKYLRPQVPAGQLLCTVQQSEAEANKPAEQRKCFLGWSVVNRCNVVATPANPLRNIFYTAIFYRSMLKNVTGVFLGRGAEDVISDHDGNRSIFTVRNSYRGFFETYRISERMAALGVGQYAPQAMKSMLISFGFNGGVDKGAILLDAYLKGRESAKLKLKESDFDFTQIERNTRWGTLVSFKALYKALALSEEDEKKYLSMSAQLKSVGINPSGFEKKYAQMKKIIKTDKASQADFKVFVEKFKNHRIDLLQTILDGTYTLSFPEFMVIAHAAFTNRSGQNLGGAPGYLNFIMKRQLELDRVIGARKCTDENYLKFF